MVNYISKYYNTTNYSFPSNILQLITKLSLFQNKYYIEDVKQIALDDTVSNLIKESKTMPKRLKKEIDRFFKDTAPGTAIIIHPENYRYFLGVIQGPDGSPYENGIFYVEIFITKQYPMKPPRCRFITPISHPNVDVLGRICLDVLKDKWTPALTMARVLLSIQLLLQDPNPDDPLDSSSTMYWRYDRRTTEVEEWKATQKHPQFPKT